jgi:hypothetical protein
MFTRNKRLVISAVLIVLLALTPATLAQETSAAINDWAGLKTVTAGSKIDVKLKSGKKVKGKLIGVSGTTLRLSGKNTPLELKQEEVLSIYQIRGKSAIKTTLISTGVGLGAGAGLGAAVGGKDRPLISALGAILGTGLGATYGLVSGLSSHNRTLIYQAKQP